MPEEHDELEDFEDPDLVAYLRRWATDLERGKAKPPTSPRRPLDAEDLIEAAEAATGEPGKQSAIEPHLLGTAIEAQATGFRPWEDEQANTSRTRPFRRLYPWIVAIAAALPLTAGVSWWYLVESHRTFDVRRVEAAMDVRVGYSDFETTVRGGRGLRPLSTAYVYFTIPGRVYYSLLVLNGEHELTVDTSNETYDPPADLPRCRLPWRLPAAEGERTESETVLVVLSKSPWEEIETFVALMEPRLSGTREDRIAQLLMEIHDTRSDLAVAATSYFVEGKSP